MLQDQFLNNVFLTHFWAIFGSDTAHFHRILGFPMDQNVSLEAQHTPKILVRASQTVYDHF